MTIPKRHPAGIRAGTFLVTSSTWNRRRLFQADPWAKLFLDVLYENRRLGRFLLHAFVVMRDHFHLLISVPLDPGLEKAAQYIKGGFSYRAGKELNSRLEGWQRGFDDQWIQDEEAFIAARTYVLQNPVRAHLAENPESYPFCSAYPGFEVDPAPAFGAKAPRFFAASRHG